MPKGWQLMESKFNFEDKAVTVSIVTYNSIDEIGKLLNSISACDYFANMEVYVIDNASCDGTVKFIKNKYPWVKIVENSCNVGFGKAHNQIINNVNSKYHIIINPDIEFDNETISRAVSYMDKNTDVAIMTPLMLNFDGTQQYLPKRNPSLRYLLGGFLEKSKWGKRIRDEYTLKNINTNDVIDIEFCTGAFMFARTEMLKSVRGFDERYFLHFEDADLTRELCKLGRAIYNPNIRVMHRWHRENRKINKSFWVALKSMIIYFHKWR